MILGFDPCFLKTLFALFVFSPLCERLIFVLTHVAGGERGRGTDCSEANKAPNVFYSVVNGG